MWRYCSFSLRGRPWRGFQNAFMDLFALFCGWWGGCPLRHFLIRDSHMSDRHFVRDISWWKGMTRGMIYYITERKNNEDDGDEGRHEVRSNSRNKERTDARLLSVLLGSVRIICGVYSWLTFVIFVHFLNAFQAVCFVFDRIEVRIRNIWMRSTLCCSSSVAPRLRHSKLHQTYRADYPEWNSGNGWHIGETVGQ